jgi:hypothetical protein
LQKLVGRHFGGQGGVFDDLAASSDHIDPGSHIGKVENEVDIFICGLPSLREIKVGRHEVKTILKVDLVLVISNKGDSPSFRVLLHLVENWRIVGSIINVYLQICCA